MLFYPELNPALPREGGGESPVGSMELFPLEFRMNMCIWKTNSHFHGDLPVTSRENQGLDSLKTLLVLS